MRNIALACGILVSVVSVSLGAMSKEEWDRASYNCLYNEDKNACQALINRGLASVERCNKDSCAFVGAVYGAAGRYREAIPYFEKAIALGIIGDIYCWERLMMSCKITIMQRNTMK